MVSELSILIPVYNCYIISLVQELRAQCCREGILFEIICLDDASAEIYQTQNRAVARLENIRYEELPRNISRAAIRNVLGRRAQYTYLLFLDNDSEIISPDYILRYVHLAQPQQVLIGGTVYAAQPPACKYTLHWRVGRCREQKTAASRNRRPYRSLHVNNALVPRAIFLNHPFDETIIHYGHEDSQWGRQLERANIPLKHLNNPVKHVGLEPAAIFLPKTEQAVRNLHQLYFKQQTGTGTSLIIWYQRLGKFKLKKLFYLLYIIGRPMLLQNLRSSSPRLVCFDLYKLGLLVQADVTKENKLPL